ncbi:MAG: hypothetical protein OXK79_08025 [Chloroflexota bacterium]|nr:hypothetical protein [Chloroflexota bacterium]
MGQGASDPPAIAVFLLAPKPPQNREFRRDPLLHAGRTSLAWKIWCVNAPVMMGWEASLDTTDPNEIFLTVTESLKLGDCPAVVLDSRLGVNEVYLYPEGLAAPDVCTPVRLRTSDVDLVGLSAVIERVYESHLKTPSSQPRANKLWKDSRRHRPHRRAEQKIQALLLPALSVAWPTCQVREEFPGTMGRIDIHIYEQNPLDYCQRTYLAVVELKVLRSFTDSGTPYSDSDNRGWVEEGIKQVEAYRVEHGHRVGALCCFDMRKEYVGEEWFAPWHRLAERKEVALRCWYLFASSRAARDA